MLNYKYYVQINLDNMYSVKTIIANSKDGLIKMLQEEKEKRIEEARCNNLIIKKEDDMIVEQLLEIIQEENHKQMNIFEFIGGCKND